MLKKQAPDKIPVSRVALLARVTRKLEETGIKLKKARSKGAKQVVGEYYLLDKEGFIKRKNIDLEELAKELKLLASHEYLE